MSGPNGSLVGYRFLYFNGQRQRRQSVPLKKVEHAYKKVEFAPSKKDGTASTKKDDTASSKKDDTASTKKNDETASSKKVDSKSSKKPKAAQKPEKPAK